MTRKGLLILTVLSSVFSLHLAAEPMPALSVTSAFPGCEAAAWKAGDKLLVFHDGVVYHYVTEQSGDQVLFVPEGTGANAFDSAKPLHVYYNVDAVNGKGEAVFSVKAEQRPGALSGRLPQWASVAPGVAGSPLSVQMAPLATVLEISASCAEPFHVDRLVVLPLGNASGFTAVTGARVNPQTGKITFPRQAGRPASIGLTIKGADLGTHPVLLVIVAGVNPGNNGLVADFFKDGRNNMRAAFLQGKDAGAKGPGLVQVDLGEKVVGISSLADFQDWMQGLAQGDRHGLKYCNEDGVIRLNADIDLSSIAGAGKNWEGIKDLRADFDGKGHTLYGYQISREGNASLFAMTSASVRNVNFGRPGDYIETTGGAFSIAAPIGMCTGSNAVIEGCMNRGEVRSADGCSGTVYVGGIVGRGSSSIRNCANLAKVTLNSPSSHGVKYAGGIVGNVVGDLATASNAISLCVNRGEVSATTSEKAWVGGIVGRVSENAKAWLIEKCTNRGKIAIVSSEARVGMLSFIGGIAAEMAAPAACHGASHTLRACVNKGVVATNADGRISMGGVAGTVKMTLLEQCSNEAEISHLSGFVSDESTMRNFVNMGGIVGFLGVESEAVSCNNAATGIVSASFPLAHRIGGVAGTSGKALVKQCSNAASVQLRLTKKIQALCAAGGICGLQDGALTDSIEGCTNTGDVSLSVNVTGLNAVAGGILAVMAKGGVVRCKNSGNVSAINELALPDMNSMAGGIVGRVYREDVSGVEACSNTGHILADAPYTPSKNLVVSGETVGQYD